MSTRTESETLPELAERLAVIDIRTAAEFLGISRRVALNLAAEGQLPGLLPRVHREYSVSARALHDWILESATRP